MTSSENTGRGQSSPVRWLTFSPLRGRKTARPRRGAGQLQLSSNENPLPPIPAVQQAIAAQTDFNRYPDPLSSKLRESLADSSKFPQRTSSQAPAAWAP